MRTGARCAAAALAALAVTVPARATAAEAGPEATLPPYQLSDTTVRGTTGSGDAPVLEPGTHRDTLAPGEKKYYAVDLDATSDVYLSAFAFPGQNSRVTSSDGLDLDLEAADGTGCADESATFDGDNATRPVGDYVVRMIAPDAGCQDAGGYLFSVERTSDVESATDVWPLELSVMVEPGLRPDAERPAPLPEDEWETEYQPPRTTLERRQVEGGTAFADAPAVGPGVWRDRLLPGQSRFYRVPVQWGQRINAEVQFGNAAGAGDDAAYVSEGVQVHLYNTARGLVERDSTGYQGDRGVLRLAPPAAAYGNRYADAGFGLRHTRTSGWYYLEVSLHPDTAAVAAGGITINLQLDLARSPGRGTPPPYATDPLPAGFGLTDDDLRAAEAGRVPGAGAEDDQLRPILAVAGLGTGTVLLLGLAGWTLAARRRA